MRWRDSLFPAMQIHCFLGRSAIAVEARQYPQHQEKHHMRKPIIWLFLLFLLSVAQKPACAGLLREENIKISSSPTMNRVDILFDENVDIRVVDGIESNDYFFVDIYSTSPSFPDKKFIIKDSILKALQSITYPDLKVTRLVLFPFNKTIFQVVDATTGFVFPVSSATAKEFVPNRRSTRHLIISTSKYRHYPLPPVMPEVGISSPNPGLILGGTGKKRVILDPGHGGTDPGAKSIHTYQGRIINEKDVVLAVAKEVESLLRKLPSVTPILTRERDTYMSLDDRKNFAERLEGDLFVSIHANATKYHTNSPSARGIEIYYLQDKSNPDLRALEEAENFEASPNQDANSKNQWELIVKNVTKDVLDVQRSYGAEACEEINNIFMLDNYYGQFKRGVRSARYRVLMNRVMPAVLIEIGFLDVSAELQNIANPEFQKRIARLISNGILRYLAKQDPKFAFYQYDLK